MLRIVKYEASYKEAWDKLVKTSKNGTFILLRDYMNYHSQRFVDFSLLVFDEEHLVAALPANVVSNKLYSHQGLTYGGLILTDQVPLFTIGEILYRIVLFLQNHEVSQIVYKPVPSFYHKAPANEEFFFLGLVQAMLSRCDTSFAIDYHAPFNFQSRRLRSVKKGEKAGVKIRVSSIFGEFWNKVLAPNLIARYDAQPVHSLKEIELLNSLFPQNIVQCDALLNNVIVAGATLYLTNEVAHTQYLSSTETGREVGALDFLIHDLITQKFREKRYFSFGTANNEGNDLNKGVAEWKAGWGAKVYPNFVFELSTSNITELSKLYGP